jgi:serine-type D-Ala-D-Ala carboxypeptidase (penicillin-binding protein 5/6)
MPPRDKARRWPGAVLLMACALATAGIRGQPPAADVPAVTADSWLLVDYASGSALAEASADVAHEPADLVKIMTVYTALHELGADSNGFDEDQPVAVSATAVRVDGPRMFLEPDSTVRLGDLLQGVIIQSGNDAAVALAEHVSGTEQIFVERMNELAVQLGMRRSRFLDATGITEGQRISARDTALLVRGLIGRFPDAYRWYREREFTYNDVTRHNSNPLLWRDTSVDGLAATRQPGDGGYALVSSADRGGARLIAVVMGSPDAESRSAGGQALIDHGFSHFETHLLYRAGDVLNRARIWMGADADVPLGVVNDFHVTIPRGRYGDLSAQLQLQTPLRAPLPAGTVVGEAQALLDDDVLVAVPVVTLEAVDSGGFWRRFSDRISLLFQ